MCGPTVGTRIWLYLGTALRRICAASFHDRRFVLTMSNIVVIIRQKRVAAHAVEIVLLCLWHALHGRRKYGAFHWCRRHRRSCIGHRMTEQRCREETQSARRHFILDKVPVWEYHVEF